MTTMNPSDAIEALKQGKASPEVVVNAFRDAGLGATKGESQPRERATLADDVDVDMEHPGTLLYMAFMRDEITKDQYAAVVDGIKGSGAGQRPAGEEDAAAPAEASEESAEEPDEG